MEQLHYGEINRRKLVPGFMDINSVKIYQLPTLNLNNNKKHMFFDFPEFHYQFIYVFI